MSLLTAPAGALRRLACLVLLPLLAACSALPGPDQAGAFPLVEDGRARPGVKRAIVLIPGAFASVNIFAPVLDWKVPDSTIVAYRFPGMDGLPLDHRVSIDGSAQVIADYLNDLAPEEVYLLGYSTGGPIAIETAERLKTAHVSIALISTAGPFPSAELSSLRSGVEVLRAMTRAGSARPQDAWAENYRTLLYGDAGLADPSKAADSAARAAAQHDSMSTPSIRRTMAHTASLMTWTLDKPGALSDAHIGVFHGTEDTVFPLTPTLRFVRKLPADRIRLYEGQGHLLFVTSRRLFDDIHDFFFDEP